MSGVHTGSGATELTLISWLMSSCARPLVDVIMAPFVEEYSSSIGRGW